MRREVVNQQNINPQTDLEDDEATPKRTNGKY